MDVVTSGMCCQESLCQELWVLGGCVPADAWGHSLGAGWVGNGQELLHLLPAAVPTATRACPLASSAPPALHHLGSLPSHLRALRMGSFFCRSSLLLLQNSHLPRAKGTKTCGQHLCPCCVQPPFPVSGLGSNWAPWFYPTMVK